MRRDESFRFAYQQFSRNFSPRRLIEVNFDISSTENDELALARTLSTHGENFLHLCLCCWFHSLSFRRRRRRPTLQKNSRQLHSSLPHWTISIKMRTLSCVSVRAFVFFCFWRVESFKWFGAADAKVCTKEWFRWQDSPERESRLWLNTHWNEKPHEGANKQQLNRTTLISLAMKLHPPLWWLCFWLNCFHLVMTLLSGSINWQRIDGSNSVIRSYLWNCVGKWSVMMRWMWNFCWELFAKFDLTCFTCRFVIYSAVLLVCLNAGNDFNASQSGQSGHSKILTGYLLSCNVIDLNVLKRGEEVELVNSTDVDALDIWSAKVHYMPKFNESLATRTWGRLTGMICNSFRISDFLICPTITSNH